MNILMIAHEQEYHHTLLSTKRLPMKCNANDQIDFDIHIFFLILYTIIYYLLFIFSKNINNNLKFYNNIFEINFFLATVNLP